MEAQWFENVGRSRDDATRLVLADALTERGDPRGEFIALTVKRAQASGLQRRRLEKLFRRHRREWLGALAAVVDSDAWLPSSARYVPYANLEGGRPPAPLLPADGFVEDNPWVEIWDRGFPVRLACQLDGKSAVGAPEWQTVRELWLQNLQPRVRLVELESQMTRNLCRVALGPTNSSGAAQQLRSYLVAIGRVDLLDAQSEWPGGT